MNLTLDQVKKVAELAKLPVNEGDLSKFSDDLNKILDYVEELEKVDTSEVLPSFNVTGLSNIQREDLVLDSLSQVDALKNAQDKNSSFFVTKGVFEEE